MQRPLGKPLLYQPSAADSRHRPARTSAISEDEASLYRLSGQNFAWMERGAPLSYSVQQAVKPGVLQDMHNLHAQRTFADSCKRANAQRVARFLGPQQLEALSPSSTARSSCSNSRHIAEDKENRVPKPSSHTYEKHEWQLAQSKRFSWEQPDPAGWQAAKGMPKFECASVSQGSAESWGTSSASAAERTLCMAMSCR